MSGELSREEVLTHVDRVVEELLDKIPILQPPVDALLIARHLGITIREEVRASRGRARKDVVLSPRDSEEQRHWLAAQIIGSQRKSALLANMGNDSDEQRPLSGGSLTNLFAEHLLLPTRWFREDAVERNFDLPSLKDRYRTAAHETIAFRMLDLSQPCVITVLDGDHILKRKSNGPRVRKQLEGPESDCWRRVIEKGQPYALCRGGWTVQGWPVDSLQILRSTTDLG